VSSGIAKINACTYLLKLIYSNLTVRASLSSTFATSSFSSSRTMVSLVVGVHLVRPIIHITLWMVAPTTGLAWLSSWAPVSVIIWVGLIGSIVVALRVWIHSLAALFAISTAPELQRIQEISRPFYESVVLKFKQISHSHHGHASWLKWQWMNFWFFLLKLFQRRKISQVYFSSGLSRITYTGKWSV
jgi:hypothetical protein